MMKKVVNKVHERVKHQFWSHDHGLHKKKPELHFN